MDTCVTNIALALQRYELIRPVIKPLHNNTADRTLHRIKDIRD